MSWETTNIILEEIIMKNNKILAVLSTSAFSGIVVTAIDDEKITTMLEYDGKLSCKRTVSLHLEEEEVWFTRNGVRYNLSEFMSIA